jgi:ABC-type transport system involved in multi-copper enzyme maturation permease subunit
MNQAILIKTIRDSAPAFVLSALGMTGFVILFGWAMVNMGDELLVFLRQFQFVRKLFEASLGIRLDGPPSITIMFAVSYTHVVVLTIAWAFVIATVTRISVGEVERGTADLLLTLPLSRWQVCTSASGAWIGYTILLSFCPWLGVFLSSRLFAVNDELQLARFLIPVANFVAINCAVGGLTTLAAAAFHRRGHAIVAVVAVALISSTLNFLEPFIAAFQQINFLSLLHYYRPVDVVRTGELPITHLATLAGVGFVSWIAGTVWFCRKDIPASN